MTGLGGERGGERRISIVDLLNLWPMAWECVGSREILNSGTDNQRPSYCFEWNLWPRKPWPVIDAVKSAPADSGNVSHGKAFHTWSIVWDRGGIVLWRSNSGRARRASTSFSHSARTIKPTPESTRKNSLNVFTVWLHIHTHTTIHNIPICFRINHL